MSNNIIMSSYNSSSTRDCSMSGWWIPHAYNLSTKFKCWCCSLARTTAFNTWSYWSVNWPTWSGSCLSILSLIFKLIVCLLIRIDRSFRNMRSTSIERVDQLGLPARQTTENSGLPRGLPPGTGRGMASPQSFQHYGARPCSKALAEK